VMGYRRRSAIGVPVEDVASLLSHRDEAKM
jgi:hypothetical protein